jgi:hypothetical protein
MGKEPRIYAELAGFARDLGYTKVTRATVHDWRKRGLLPAARSLGRTRRPPGVLPVALTDRIRAICGYHYDTDVQDLDLVAVLLFLDGADIELAVVRSGMAVLPRYPERLVALAGSRARRANPDDPDADLDAAAQSFVERRILGARVGGRDVPAGELHPGVHDVLAIHVGRMDPADADPDAIGAFIEAIGLNRGVSGPMPLGPGLTGWVGDPVADYLEATANLFGPSALAAIAAAGDAELLEGRGLSNRLFEVFRVVGPMLALGWAPGEGGLGAVVAGLDWDPVVLRCSLFLLAVTQRDGLALLVDALEPQLGDFAQATARGAEWLDAHPELEDEARRKGLMALLSEQPPSSADSDPSETGRSG